MQNDRMLKIKQIKEAIMKLLKLVATLVIIIPVVSFAKNRKVHISLVEKNTVHKFISRFASAKYQLVATSAPVSHAIKAVQAFENDDEQLFFVELTAVSSSKLEGEVARFGSVAIVRKKKTEIHEGHFCNLINPLEYWEAIPHGETNTKPRTTKKSMSKLFNDVPKINIDASYLLTKLKEFSGILPTKLDGKKVTLGERYSKAGKKLARQFLAKEYSELGYEVREHEFGNFFKGVNFIAEKKGSGPSFYMVTSHYDTVRTVGADDDGSGVIAGLVIAKALRDINHEFGIRFVAFDLEERGLLGSKAYASFLESETKMDDMLGLIQLEMLGWDGDNDAKFHVIDCDENTSPEITETVLNTIKQLDIKLIQNKACTNRSDHAAFWRYNKPAIVISQNFFGDDSNPCYHRSCDVFEKINLPYLQAITNATANSMLKLIGTY